MTLALGCIADDYTGASDLANTLTKAGLRTVQTIGVPGDLDLPEVDAVVVALKSRSIEASKAVTLSRSADQWLRARGADHVLFKICSTFDSTDAGNIGPVTDALQADLKDPIVLVTPAFPETGRTVYQGNLFVGSVPLNESPLKDHPLNPMHDANLVRILARQSRNKTGLVDIATVSKGADAVRAKLKQLAELGVRAAVVDAVFDPDLETIGRAAIDHRLSVGASGIGLGLARGLVTTGRVRASAPNASSLGAPVGGPAVCLAGSCSQATLAQIVAAEQVMPVLRLDPDAVIADKGSSRNSRLGRRTPWRRSDPDCEQFRARQGNSGSGAAWPRRGGPCDRASVCGAGRWPCGAWRAPPHRGGRRNLGRGGRSPRHSGVPGRAGDRGWCPCAAHSRDEGPRDGARAEVGQLRRPDVLFRRAEAGAIGIAARRAMLAIPWRFERRAMRIMSDYRPLAKGSVIYCLALGSGFPLAVPAPVPGAIA